MMTNFTKDELALRDKRQRETKERQNAYVQFLADQGAHAFVTLTINRGARSLESMKENLAKWAYYVDGRLNKRTRRIPSLHPNKRLQGWFAPELTASNGHWHGLVKFPEKVLKSKLQMLQSPAVINHCWRSIFESGDAKLIPIFNPNGVARYCLKEHFSGNDFYGSLIELSDFWPASKPGRIS